MLNVIWLMFWKELNEALSDGNGRYIDIYQENIKWRKDRSKNTQKFHQPWSATFWKICIITVWAFEKYRESYLVCTKMQNKLLDCEDHPKRPDCKGKQVCEKAAVEERKGWERWNASLEGMFISSNRVPRVAQGRVDFTSGLGFLWKCP